MKKENKNLNIQIGAIIKKIATQRGVSETKLAQMIHCTCSTMNDIYRRYSINTELLWKISIVLEYNFFTEIYGKSLDIVLQKEQDLSVITIVVSSDKITLEQKNGIITKTEYRKIDKK